MPWLLWLHRVAVFVSRTCSTIHDVAILVKFGNRLSMQYHENLTTRERRFSILFLPPPEAERSQLSIEPVEPLFGEELEDIGPSDEFFERP